MDSVKYGVRNVCRFHYSCFPFLLFIVYRACLWRNVIFSLRFMGGTIINLAGEWITSFEKWCESLAVYTDCVLPSSILSKFWLTIDTQTQTSTSRLVSITEYTNAGYWITQTNTTRHRLWLVYTRAREERVCTVQFNLCYHKRQSGANNTVLWLWTLSDTPSSYSLQPYSFSLVCRFQ